MKKIMLIAAFCMPIIFGGCEPIEVVDNGVSIHGFVYDAKTKNPIQGATLTMLPGGRTCYTGTNGAYIFSEGLEWDVVYQIQATAIGYHADKKPITLLPGESHELSFELIPLEE